MSKSLARRSMVAVACSVLWATSAAADGAKNVDGTTPSGWNGYVIVGGAVLPDYEGSSHYKAMPGADAKLGYDEYYLELQGTRLHANLMPAVLPFGFELGPALAYRFGRSSVHNDRVDQLRDIHGSLAAGAFARIYTSSVFQQNDELAFNAESLTGVGSNASGTTVDFGPSYSFSPWTQWRLGVNVTATYADGQYNQTYFGIDSHDAARSGFSTYTAHGGMKDVGVSLKATYLWTEQWAVTGTVGVSRLLGDAANSPIVKHSGSPVQGIAILGVMYRF